MIPVKKFFMIEEKDELVEKLVNEIIEKDYSYVLVYRKDRSNIVGTIKMK